VILFAPVAALLAVALTSPALVLPFYSGGSRGWLGSSLYFLSLGAIFGKLGIIRFASDHSPCCG
jgi:H+/gluconate symporter-like permease